jgi:rhamnulokinase
LLELLGASFPGLEGIRGLLPELVEPGTVIGPLRAKAQSLTGLGPVPVVAVASHDTASAIVGTPLPEPARPEGAEKPQVSAYISCGTWSLVGLELDEPVLTEAARTASFTNELGLDGTVRFLHNVVGLWVQNECRRQFERDGDPISLTDLHAQIDAEDFDAGDLGPVVIDLSDPAFLAPGDMPSRVRAAAMAAGLPVPDSRAAVVSVVLDSLAAAYADAIDTAARLADVEVTQINIVGGGSQNHILCRRTAKASGLPVVAGPTEAAALGNVLVSARALGVVGGTLADLRRSVAASFPTTVYRP